jgi:hypothetical protein
MSIPSGKRNKAADREPKGKTLTVVAPSVDGGADKEYTVVFEKKALYKRPSFAR